MQVIAHQEMNNQLVNLRSPLCTPILVWKDGRLLHFRIPFCLLFQGQILIGVGSIE